MKISSFGKYALGVTAAAALLAGCSSGSALGPSSTTGMPSGTHVGGALALRGLLTTALHPGVPNAHPYSPDKKKHHKGKTFQYLTDFDDSAAFQFDYPKSDASIGEISGATDAQGECTKNGKKTFWITESGADSVDEFKAGGTSPIATLSITAGEPAGCSVDPGTGNLAESILSTGQIVIFTGAKGSGTAISTPLIEAFFVGYDNAGNVFADGLNANDAFGLIEIPKGSSTAETITTSNSVTFPGQVQWDGKNITVNDQESHVIYQYTVSGTTATEVGSTPLTGTSDCVQTWIAKSIVFCPDAGNANGTVFKYPAGGSSIATLTAGFALPIGSVQVSTK